MTKPVQIGKRHLIDIAGGLHSPFFQVVCACGYCGPQRTTFQVAWVDVDRHARRFAGD